MRGAAIEFRSIHEPAAGPKWAEMATRLWPGYSEWFLKEGDAARPTYLACLHALREHMPELLPTYERLVELAGGGDRVARMLSLYRPTPYLSACSQAVWTRGRPFLVRNYDYRPDLWDAVLLYTSWNGRGVIAMSDCMWGVLDGMNESGLVVSLAFGGRKVVGDGFGIPLVLRYVLEFCETTPDAVAALSRIPSHMAYNVTVLDRAGKTRTVFMAPDQPAVVSDQRHAVNHQRTRDWDRFADATGSVEREECLLVALKNTDETPTRFVKRFLESPLRSMHFDRGWGTLYSAIYRPDVGAADYRWPGADDPFHVSFSEFEEIQRTITFPN